MKFYPFFQVQLRQSLCGRGCELTPSIHSLLILVALGPLRLSWAQWVKKETFPGLCWSWETGSFSPLLLQECEGGVRTWSLGRGTRWRHLGPWHGAVAPSALDYAVQAIIWEQTKVRSLFLKLLSFWFSLGSPILYPKNLPSSVKSSQRASA